MTFRLMDVTAPRTFELTPPETGFCDALPSGSRIYYIGNEDPLTSGRFIRAGHSVQFHEKNRDLRLLSLPESSIDGIWWSEASQTFTLEDAHRVLNTFFRGLKPGGLLAFSFLKQESPDLVSRAWKPFALQSLLRQTGYLLLAPYEQGSRGLYLCRRLS